MNGLVQDIRYALRQLRKAPVFALTAVVTLALGIGANTAIFTVFNQVLLRMLPVQKPHELVQLQFIGTDRGYINVFGGDSTMYFSNPMYRDLAGKNTVFSGLIANVETSVGIVWNGQGQVANAEAVSGNYFDVLGVSPALGRTLHEPDDRVKNGSAVAVLSYTAWKTHFASSTDVVNQTLLVNGQPFTIVGVAAPGFSSAITGFKPEIFVPITMQSVVYPGPDLLSVRRARWLNIVGRLKPGISPATAQAEMTVLWKQLRTEELPGVPHATAQFAEGFVAKSSLLLLDDSKGFSPLRDNLKTPLLILMGMVLLLAAMTCMNLANLLLVRGAARGKEFAVRYALGAARGRIVRQLLVEGILLGGVGGALGLALAPAAAALLVRRVTDATGEIAFATRPDAAVLWFNLLLSLGISVLFSLAPAWQMMKPDMTDALRQKAGGAHGAQRFRTVAVGMQIGLSVLLLSGAGLFVRTLHQLKGQSMGLATDHLVEFALDPSISGYKIADALTVHDRLRADLEKLPGVTMVGATTDPVLSGNQSDDVINVDGTHPSPDAELGMEDAFVTPGYFSALKIPVLAGRMFTDADRNDAAKVIVINREFALKYFGSPEQALGHMLGQGRGNLVFDRHIVGVVGDTKHRGVRADMRPMVYQPYFQNAKNLSGLEYYVRTTQAPQLAENMIRGAVHDVDAKLVPDQMQTMEEQIDANVSGERMIALLAACFALIALTTTAVGLYGVLAYATAQRTQEIGIRMALGAQRWEVVRVVLGGTARLAGIAILVALPVSVGLSQLLRSQLFEVSPFDPLTLFVCAAVTAGMVLLAASIPARRAASVDPIQALRTE